MLKMGTEVVTIPEREEDQEEGEIIDVEAYNNHLLELESISSEEEENLRDRIRELETRNKELEKLAAVAKEERRTYNYDNSDFVTISSEEEFFEPKYPKFEVRMLHPPNKRKTNGFNRDRNRHPMYRCKSPDKLKPDSTILDFKRRRRSMSPEFYQDRPKINRKDRVKPDRSENHRRDHKKKKKRSVRRQYSESDSEDEKYKRSQLDAALKRDTIARPQNMENPLMKKLKLRPGSSNKENEHQTTNGDLMVEEQKRNKSESEEIDDELIALRLQALKSKQEVKELINEVSIEIPRTQPDPLPEPEIKDFDEDELELRMIALKSAIVKKAVARKKQKEKPYSPTDGLEFNTPVSPGNPYASSESNMEISPAVSPTLDDAVLQPIDMEIATPENLSNSPTFYSFDEASMKLVPDHMLGQPLQDLSGPWGSLVPVLVPVVYPNQMIPIMPKTTKNCIPIEFLNGSIRDELNSITRSNTQSPTVCNDMSMENDVSSKLRPRSRSLDFHTTQSKSEIQESQIDDDEEQALRTLLLAKLASPKNQSKKSVPSTLKPLTTETANDLDLNETLNSDELSNIEDNLKKAASRFKELSEQEEIMIEASLDKILSKTSDEEINVNGHENESSINLKEVVERLKLSRAKEKLHETKIVENDVKRCEKVEDHEILVKPQLEVNSSSQEILNRVSEVSIQKEISSKAPEIIEQEQPKIASNQIQILPLQSKPVVETVFVKEASKSQVQAISQLKPKQITKAMTSITASQQQKPKIPVLTAKAAPIIMKRKLKTNSSIINVPFQHKTPQSKSNTTSKTLNIPSASSSTSSSIVSLESVIKPVPKVIIQLGQSSSDESDSDSNQDEKSPMNDSNLSNLNVSAVASPSHINEFNENVPSPIEVQKNTQETKKELPKVDPIFESKLDEFLKQARAKTEKASQNMKPSKETVSQKTLPKTPSAVRHLPVSSQIEYKKLLAKMQLLEKQKQARSKIAPKSSINVEEGGNIKVTVENKLSTILPQSVIPSKENSHPPAPPIRKVLGNKVIVQTTPVTQPDTFESRLSKMTDEQKDKALQKYEASYNEFSAQFVSQLTDFMDTISEATQEKRKQIQLEMEAEELRAKLAAVESQLGYQRTKVGKIYPKISMSHKKILQSRDKYIKMGKCCTKLGQTVRGSDYQFKNEAKDKIVETLRQLPVKTKNLKNAKEEYLKELSAKTSSENSIERAKATSDESNNSNSYQSVLECMTSTQTGSNSNHDGVLCPFDLSGKCSDKECKFVHLT